MSEADALAAPAAELKECVRLAVRCAIHVDATDELLVEVVKNLGVIDPMECEVLA